MNQKYKPIGEIIVGINGWIEEGHDASVTIIDANEDNCKILGALEEEKVTKNKCAYNTLPVKSLDALIKYLKIDVSDIKKVVFGWNLPMLFQGKNRLMEFSDKQILRMLFPNNNIENKTVGYIDHHLAHAACAFRTSGFERAIVLILDGQGENESGSLWIGQNNGLQRIKTIDIYSSFGYLYEAVNEILGFKVNESGKTMGLAAYGTDQYLDRIKSCFYIRDNFCLNDSMKKYKTAAKRFSSGHMDMQKTCIIMWKLFFAEKLGIKPLDKKITSFYDVEEKYRNLAASVQSFLEFAAMELLKPVIEETNIRNVCVGGGVALNCKMNGVLLSQDMVDDIYINPAANDAGVSMGAALEYAKQMGLCSWVPFSGGGLEYLGIEFEDSYIIGKIEEYGMNYDVYDNAEQIIADEVNRGGIVALFQGRNEWGPRALGNRSIIASAASKTMLDYINSKIKKRELGRPLGPTILFDNDEFEDVKGKKSAKYMNIAFRAGADMEKYEAVVHCDNTYRPQFLEKENNDIYYRQIRKIKETSGEAAIINTSFNIETPIIYNVDDAITAFFKSKLTCLVFNNRIVLKK